MDSPSKVLEKFNARLKSHASPLQSRKKDIQKAYYKLLKIQPSALDNHLANLDKLQQKLTKQIMEIDSSLQNQDKYFKYQNGYFFSEGVNEKLVKQLAKLRNNKQETVSYGFASKVLPFVNGSSLSKSISIPGYLFKKITKKRLQNIRQNDSLQRRLFFNKLTKKWQYHEDDRDHQLFRFNTQGYQKQKKRDSPIISFKDKDNKFNGNIDNFEPKFVQRRNISQMRYQKNKQFFKNQDSLDKLETDKIFIPKKVKIFQAINTSSISNQSRIISKSLKLPQFPKYSQSNDISLFQLSNQLNQENKIVAVWKAPISELNLLGLISIDIRQNYQGISYCFMKKYCWQRQCLSCRFFNSILDWMSKTYVFIDKLILNVQKNIFYSIFVQFNWQMISWVDSQKIKISYKRMLL